MVEIRGYRYGKSQSGSEGYLPETYLIVTSAHLPTLSDRLMKFAVDMKLRDGTLSMKVRIGI